MTSQTLHEAYQGLEPVPVWRHFHDLNQIPRASGNETAAIEHVTKWAEANGFEWKKDQKGNLCVKVPGTQGHENDPAICLQGHIDMVPEKTPDKIHDFATDPVTPVRDEDFIRADETTLGADNGIGLAAAMTVATDPEAIHPPLELLVTLDEERGFFGTFAIDMAALGITSREIINLDNEQLGETGIESAGLRMETGTRPLERETEKPTQKGKYYKIVIKGLPGGHSAKNIADGKPNAIKVMATILEPRKKLLRLVSINGGERVNGIPINCEAIVFVPEENEVDFYTTITADKVLEVVEQHKGTAELTEPTPEEIACANMTEQTHDAVLAVLNGITSGPDSMHPEHPEIPFTSRNLGTVRTNPSDITIGYSMRSPSPEEIDRVSAEISGISAGHGFLTKKDFQIPTWNAVRNSRVVTAMNKAYEDVTGTPAKLGATHGGLETSVLTVKLADYHHVPIEEIGSGAVGPDIKDPHSPSERVSVKSVETFYKQLRKVLSLLAEPKAA